RARVETRESAKGVAYVGEGARTGKQRITGGHPRSQHAAANRLLRQGHRRDTLPVAKIQTDRARRRQILGEIILRMRFEKTPVLSEPAEIGGALLHLQP